MHTTTWQQAYAGLMPEELLEPTPALIEGRTRFWTETLKESGSREVTLVATEGDEVIGFSHASSSREGDSKDETAELLAIYVLADRWGTGIGARLHDETLSRLGSLGFSAATLWVLSTNERAKTFYGYKGWETDGADKTESIAGYPIHEVRYRKALNMPQLRSRPS